MEHVFKELLSDTNKFLTVNDTLPNDLWLKSDIINTLLPQTVTVCH